VLAFLTQRLLQIIPTLIIVSMLIFGLQQLLPGDPALIMAGSRACCRATWANRCGSRAPSAPW
jgi:ABC-type dipeptide/oligopeptide/nickel transport system permease component